jgi:fimbrial isopeptide formation D2 family protein/LPXTG-motif cell wall-anchored protein
MKNLKKIMALIIAMVMVVGTMSMTAFAATTQGAATADGKVIITGLDKDDTVKLYKVIGWEDSKGWKLENGFTVPQFDGKLGTANKAVSIDTGVVDTINGQIKNTTPVAASGTIDESGKFEATVDPGMYIAIVTAKTPGTVYNPIIVSSDFVVDGNSIDASADSSVIPKSEGAASAVAKKSTIELKKEGTDETTVDANNHETVAVGDTVNFKIETEIPPFVTYNKPIFTITDQLSDGITLGNVDTIVVTKPAGLEKDRDYTVEKVDAHKFVVTFKEAYLKTVAANTAVQIDYPATITSDAVKSVNPENNTVTLEYQRDPQSNSDKTTEKVRDITNHYSFTIDGNLLGQDNYSATEVVKVGVSADGTEIKETVKLANGNKVGALEGATFKLVYKEDVKDGEDTVIHHAGDVVKTKNAAGDTITWNEDQISTGADGRMTITGLDAGKYQLIEVDAPDGYIKMQNAVDVEIQATVKNVTYKDEDGCTINTTELESYKVIIGGKETANYTITNSKNVVKTSSSIGDSVVGTDASSGKLKNTKGVELPSTGGIGTTLFYIIGAILVVGAGILLVTRRRMSAK